MEKVVWLSLSLFFKQKHNSKPRDKKEEDERREGRWWEDIAQVSHIQ